MAGPLLPGGTHRARVRCGLRRRRGVLFGISGPTAHPPCLAAVLNVVPSCATSRRSGCAQTAGESRSWWWMARSCADYQPDCIREPRTAAGTATPSYPSACDNDDAVGDPHRVAHGRLTSADAGRPAKAAHRPVSGQAIAALASNHTGDDSLPLEPLGGAQRISQRAEVRTRLRRRHERPDGDGRYPAVSEMVTTSRMAGP